MTISERPTQTVVGEVVAVYRECKVCGDWKLLEHFLLLDPHGQVSRGVHQCAACRRTAREGPRGGRPAA
jgi:hypothetical protein